MLHVLLGRLIMFCIRTALVLLQDGGDGSRPSARAAHARRDARLLRLRHSRMAALFLCSREGAARAA
jgi:hypothetical protein